MSTDYYVLVVANGDIETHGPYESADERAL